MSAKPGFADTKYASALTVDFPASSTVKYQCLSFKPPSLDGLRPPLPIVYSPHRHQRELLRTQMMSPRSNSFPLHMRLSMNSLGEGNGNPLQYSFLENPMDGGAWWAAVRGVVKSQTRFERLHFHFPLSCIGEGNGNPLQCFCLGNPRDGGAWWAAVYGVVQSQTRLK